ncbi:MAG TPA: MarR family winged helix-turn-helix transcriptional regulator [Candidatus Baltobacteraceae bacterium]|nr:MarR family winged helix-turn-helix transcriptional regulator [Candidatus Baltobacteraceae bacterium]
MQTIHEAGACSKVPAVLREGIGWPVARLAHAFTNAHNEALAPLGLSLRTFAVLAMVEAGAAKSQLEIAQSVGLDKTTLVAAIDDLERRDFVRRTPDPDDRRARIVGITANGQTMLSEAAEVVRANERRILGGIAHDKAANVKATLIALLSGPLNAYLDRAGSCL